MHTHNLFSPIIVAILIFTAISKPCYGQVNQQYNVCNQTYSCGSNIRNMRYPFWGDGRPQYCGHPQFQLKCQNTEYPTVTINDRSFQVLGINQSSHVMTIARIDLWDSYCTQNLSNISLDGNFFWYSQAVRDLFMFYDCTQNNFTRGLSNNFTCTNLGSDGGKSLGFYADESLLRALLLGNVTKFEGVLCRVNVEVPVLRVALDELSSKSLSLQEALNQGFEVVYYAENAACLGCEESGGICGSDSSSLVFVCHCQDHTHPRNCRNDDIINVRRKLLIGFGTTGITIIVMSLIFIIYHFRYKKRCATSSWVSRKTFLHRSSMKDLEKAGTYLNVQVFSYSELEKATSNFDSKTELGDGGFGTVYQGKLRDGRIVAVKRLYEHNFKRVEQFMNEVEILTRLRHQNLVSLYGCTTHHCRELLLVYEYIPNGTVADHLHGERGKPGSLCWTTRMSIAVETASALAYLHASDVIHRDVKTNNILLDNNFCVKVADFGLSRLFPNDVTHVSTAPQGTPGYVDPQYHECYQLTDKSDVYSLGVVLVELISSKPAVDISRHRHEINLSTMAINKIQNHALHELVDPRLGFDSDYEVRKMITKVAELAFQCLQNESDSRPSMENVLEVLKGIQSEDCAMKNAEVVDIREDDVVLLTSKSPTLSPSR
ncbi:LEAF RUST 10 DISEASE-RESISTANCE LOCUS RECEPTOR-LIKE PROTEIN KINASE-like 1.4 [Camellia sinensis]|uniref:LEAF RUST 10 DISEASE-RESISTANCE LOCUS RECEPTOR-LIKE PROTEIN KINASE-like 1.4 n=1 Tax=Camellia sinensis TaxID=4442 RepID=UPI00103675C4|nr:LEAF RUST 10 DISEASE-RESISTANCE LOCUS RECEPTOR-LIKE PROTEIN KINASE-like 1.4 [Camellia sinensis]